MQVQVTGTTFYRDTNSMALVNKDSAGLNDYMNKRKIAERQRDEINSVKKEMESIRNDMTEIKTIMLQLLNKG